MIVWKSGLRSLPGRVRELAWCLTALILGLSVCAASASLATQAGKTLESTIAADAAELNILPDGVLVAPGSAPAPSPLDEDVVGAIGEIPGVADVRGQVRGGPLYVRSADGGLVLPRLRPQRTGDLVAGISVTAGRAPEGQDEVALDASTMALGGYSIGDAVELAAPGRSRTVRATLVGTVAADAGGDMSLVVLSTPMARGLFLGGAEGHNRVRITLAPDADRGAVREQLMRQIPEGYTLRTSSDVSAAVLWRLEPRLTLIWVALCAATLLAGLAAVVLVGGTVAQLVDARREELGRLRRLGASRLQLTLPALAEALLLGVLGGAVALPVGHAMAQNLSRTAGTHGLSLGTTVPALPGWASLLIVAVGAASTVLFARRRLVSATVARSPGRYDQAAPRLRFSDATWSSLGLVLIGVALLVVGAVVPSMPAPLAWATLGAGVLLAGVAVAAPVLGLAPARLLGAAGSRLTRGMGTLAARRISRHPATFIKGAALLVLVTGVAATVALLSASRAASTEERIPQNVRGDLFVTSPVPGGLDVGIRSAIGLVPGLRVVGSYGISSTVGHGQPLRVMTGDVGTLGRVVAVHTTEGRPAQAIDEVMASTGAAERLDVARGDTLTLLINQQQVEARVVGLFDPLEGPDQADLISLRGTFTSRGVPDNDALVSLALRDSAKRATMQAQLTKLFVGDPFVRVLTAGELAAADESLVPDTAATVRALILPFLVFCTIGLAGMLVVRLRRRAPEFRALRHVGADRVDIVTLVAAESVILGISGALLGAVAGTVAGLGLRHVLRTDGFAVLVVPWPTLLGLLLAGTVVGVAAAVAPALLAHRMLPIAPADAGIGAVAAVYGGAHTGERHKGAESAGMPADPQT